MGHKKYLNSAYFCSREALPEFYPCVSSDAKVCLTKWSNSGFDQVLDKAVKSQCEHHGIIRMYSCAKKPRIEMAVDA